MRNPLARHTGAKNREPDGLPDAFSIPASAAARIGRGRTCRVEEPRRCTYACWRRYDEVEESGPRGGTGAGAAGRPGDGGATWTKTAALKGRRGQVAMAADGAVILRAPEQANEVWRSADGGATWTAVAGLAQPGLRPVADPVDARVFYAYDGTALLASTDGGATFAPRAGRPAGGARLVRPAPGRGADVWVALKNGGLVRSVDGGAHFAPLAAVRYCGA